MDDDIMIMEFTGGTNNAQHEVTEETAAITNDGNNHERKDRPIPDDVPTTVDPPVDPPVDPEDEVIMEFLQEQSEDTDDLLDDIPTIVTTATTTADNNSTSNPNGLTLLTGRLPQILYMSCDPDNLTTYQVLLRKQLELFEANELQVQQNKQGRNKPIVLGQVGVRCRHCAITAHKNKNKGSMYFPAKLIHVYQAAQNMASTHYLLSGACENIPTEVRNKLIELRGDNTLENRNKIAGGKEHWAETTKALGVYEDEYGLRFTKTLLLM